MSDFIAIRTPVRVACDIYAVGLELARLVHEVLDATEARFYLKDQLDRSTTQVALQIARAGREVSSERWRAYRAAVATVTDIGTLLDVLEAQQATSKPGALAAARYVARRLADELAPLASVRTSPV
jgi:hypothetical protein